MNSIESKVIESLKKRYASGLRIIKKTHRGEASIGSLSVAGLPLFPPDRGLYPLNSAYQRWEKCEDKARSVAVNKEEWDWWERIETGEFPGFKIDINSQQQKYVGIMPHIFSDGSFASDWAKYSEKEVLIVMAQAKADARMAGYGHSHSRSFRND